MQQILYSLTITMWSRILHITFAYSILLIFYGNCDKDPTKVGVEFYSHPMIYTTNSMTETGKWCVNDCVDGQCVVDIDTAENCTRSNTPAPTFYTTGQSYTAQYKCTSRCTFLKGDKFPRCFVDYDWNKIDYCNPEYTKELEYRDFTESNGPCANPCEPSLTLATPNGTCNDGAGILRTCYIDKNLYETVKTLKGYKCNGQCLRHGRSYSWCYYYDKSWDYCARPALHKMECYKCSLPISRDSDETVSEYAERMESAPNVTTVTVNDSNNPIYKYTYNETRLENGTVVKIPLVVRARLDKSHIKEKDSRGTNSISPESRTNCHFMGMTGRDVVGHLIAYKLGGPAEFYNFVPMTQAINIGNIGGGNVYTPSAWAATEREMAQFVGNEDGRSTVTVVLRYNYTDLVYPYRPIRIGWGQWDSTASGDPIVNCPNYWYNNEPDANDPECHQS